MIKAATSVQSRHVLSSLCAGISKEVIAQQFITNTDPRFNAGIGTSVNSLVTQATAEQEDHTPMEQETATVKMINKTPFLPDRGTERENFPQVADCSRATVRVLRSIDQSKGAAFHTYNLADHRCTRLLIKSLGMNMPE